MSSRAAVTCSSSATSGVVEVGFPRRPRCRVNGETRERGSSVRTRLRATLRASRRSDSKITKVTGAAADGSSDCLARSEKWLAGGIE